MRMGQEGAARETVRASQTGTWAYLGELLCCASGPHRSAQKPNRRIGDDFNFAGGHREDDVTLFDKAYDTDDVGLFVKLLSSTQEIDKLEERMHPWAADPRSVGALAATQLAILASKDNEPEIKDDIRERGGIKALVALLASHETDRQHAAVVALSFLSVDNPKNAIEMFEAGALPYLVNGMKSDIDGMRAATAQTTRNIFVLDLKYRREFMKAGGIVNLVNLLQLPPAGVGTSEEALYTQLEAVYHLEDLIIDSGGELPDYIAAVKAAGAVQKLNTLLSCKNPDLSDAANYLLARLV